MDVIGDLGKIIVVHEIDVPRGFHFFPNEIIPKILGVVIIGGMIRASLLTNCKTDSTFLAWTVSLKGFILPELDRIKKRGMRITTYERNENLFLCSRLCIEFSPTPM